MSLRGSPAYLTLALVAAACASGSGMSDETAYQQSLGRITYATLQQGLDKVFRKYTIPIYRQEEQFATIYVESEWVTREPFADERTQGVTAARTRFVINGRRSDGPVFRTTITAENQVRSERNAEWHQSTLTPEFLEYVRTIVLDLQAEVRTGIR